MAGPDACSECVMRFANIFDIIFIIFVIYKIVKGYQRFDEGLVRDV